LAPINVSKGDIHARLWPDTFVSDITLHSLVSELRRALGEPAGDPQFIRTVHGFGYAFAGSVDERDRRPSQAPRRLRGYLTGETGRLSLFEGENRLGRDADDVIELPSPTISRHHATIRFEAEPWIEDLGSKNGTFICDARVTTPVRLTDGDRVRLGSLLFTFRLSHATGVMSTQSDVE
jgi:hypothetical protein